MQKGGRKEQARHVNEICRREEELSKRGMLMRDAEGRKKEAREAC